MNLTIGPLAETHERSRFSSGVEALDRWFHEQAGANYCFADAVISTATLDMAINLRVARMLKTLL